MKTEIIIRTIPGREQYLRRALESLIAQTSRSFRAIIVQDGGASVLPAISDLIEQLPAREFILLEQGGSRSHAANVGLAACKGSFVGFLDDDDFLEPDHIELLAERLEKDPSLAAVYAAALRRYVIRDGNEEKLISAKIQYNVAWERDALLRRNLFPIQAILLRRSELPPRGFSTELDTLEDWAFWLDALLGKRVVAIPQVTSAYNLPARIADTLRRIEEHEANEERVEALTGDYSISVGHLRFILDRYRGSPAHVSGAPLSALAWEGVNRGIRFARKVYRELQRRPGLLPRWVKGPLNNSLRFVKVKLTRAVGRVPSDERAPRQPVSAAAERLSAALSAESVKGPAFGSKSYVAFTSCNLHYLPKARVLAESVREHRPDAEFHLVLGDRIPDWLKRGVEDGTEPFDAVFPVGTVTRAENLRADIFQYTVVELCTVLKPRYIHNVFFGSEASPSWKGVLYFDPDVKLFGRCEQAFEGLARHPAVVTPHCPRPATTDADIWTNERSVNAHGIYNLGFLAVANTETGAEIARYWDRRTSLGCFDEMSQGIFTDQKWMNQLAIHFPEVLVLLDPTYNLASWNFGPPELEYRDGRLLVEGKDLNFFHYSGFDGNVIARIASMLGKTEIIKKVLGDYKQDVAAHALPPDEKTWALAFYENGDVITRAQRRLYRQNEDMRIAFPDPYSTGTHASYHAWLKRQFPPVDDLYSDKYFLPRHF